MQTARQKKPLSKSESYRVVAEINRRAALKKLSLVDDKFLAQANFIQDPSRKKAALCTRRAGKTEGVARGLVDVCLHNDGVAVLYIGLTRDSCRRIFWEDALKPLLNRFKNQIRFKKNETRLEILFPNGSRIYCLGMDAKKDEMQKLLGGKYKRIVIDEAGSFRVDLEQLIDEILWPSLADLEGDVWLTGTPTEFTGSYFYKITRQDAIPREPGWSVHEWSGHENPYMQKQWIRELAALKLNKPRVAETPAFKRMWLGKWEIDKDRLVYKYDRARNWIAKLPGPIEEYVFGLGVDLGWDDESSFVLSAYSGRSKILYLMRPEKKSYMDITAVAEKIREYGSRYDIYSMVIDGANKQAVEEMRRRHQLPLMSADKAGKANFIDIFNSELIHGEIMLVGEDTDIIEQEWGSLIWDPKHENKREEHPGCDNHLADACLYIWRNQRQYLYREPIKKEKKSEEKRVEEWIDRELAKEQGDKDLPAWMRYGGM